MRIGIFSRIKTHRTQSYEDIAYVTTGSISSGTTSCTPGYGTVAEGQALLTVVTSKIQTAVVETPSGDRRIKEIIASTASNGSNAGPVRQTLFFKESDGTESGTKTITVPGGNSVQAAIYSFSKDSRLHWNIAVYQGHHNTFSTSNFSVTSYENVDSEPGDVFLVLAGVNANLYLWSAQTLTHTGATLTTTAQELTEVGTESGNNLEQIASLFTVASGTGSGKLTFTMTSSGNSATNPIGVVQFVRLRQSSTAQTWEPSGLRVWRAADIVQTTYSGDGSSIWDGMRTSITQTGSPANEKYSIATFNGRPCFKFEAQLQNSTNYVMRAEVSQPIPWQPAWVIGTQLIHEVRWETPADAPTVYREWDFTQNHTGTAPGGPWPLNSPIFYLAWAYAGQTGWTGGGTATGGELAVINKAAGTRHKYASVTWAASKVYRVLYHVKFGAADQGTCLKVGVSVDGGAMTWVHQQFDVKTVFADADIATDGSPANVGGSPKIGVYNHSMTGGTAVSNSIAAGNSGYILYSPCMKMIIQQPSDVGYISDVTDNNNPIYDYVDTSDE
jgi:hypothetical protein